MARKASTNNLKDANKNHKENRFNTGPWDASPKALLLKAFVELIHLPRVGFQLKGQCQVGLSCSFKKSAGDAGRPFALAVGSPSGSWTWWQSADVHEPGAITN